jgi:hypothetical protein
MIALPGIFYSQAHETEALIITNGHGWNILEWTGVSHDGFATDRTPSTALAKAAKVSW